MQKQQIGEEKLQEVQFIIEHMETYLYEWCYYQYIKMKEYLADYNCTLLIYNADAFLKYKGQFQQDNDKYVALLKEAFENSKAKLIPHSLKEQVSTDLLNPKEACLLDMRAQKQLQSNQNWKRVIFGGILGDHPPRDRSKPLRDILPEMRHLGELQLSTDTAVLVTRLILKTKMKLSDIPFVKQPTIKGQNKNGQKTKVQMEGFSYISRQLDIETGKIREGVDKKQKKKIYIHQGVERLLLNQDLDPNNIM